MLNTAEPTTTRISLGGSSIHDGTVVDVTGHHRPIGLLLVTGDHRGYDLSLQLRGDLSDTHRLAILRSIQREIAQRIEFLDGP